MAQRHRFVTSGEALGTAIILAALCSFFSWYGLLALGFRIGLIRLQMTNPHGRAFRLELYCQPVFLGVRAAGIVLVFWFVLRLVYRFGSKFAPPKSS